MGGLKVFFSHGFRPFFAGAGLWAVVGIALWLVINGGHIDMPAGLATVNWHVHTMLAGYVSAVVAGFLLTAVPNWTGTTPVSGGPLVGLFLLWLAGRVATLCSAFLPQLFIAVVDLSFLLAIIGFTAPAIIKAKNKRNLIVVGLIGLIWLGQLLRHIGAAFDSDISDLGGRFGLSAIFLLVVLIGGRVVPAFSRNWFRANQIDASPPDFNGVDRLAVFTAATALALWTFQAPETLTGIIFLGTALVHLGRLGRWQGWCGWREPLVVVMHIAYLWLPIGFGLMGLSLAFDLVPQSVALHALTVGGVGTITLAIMTRATLGHSGRALSANAMTTVIYVMITFAALLRVAGPLLSDSIAVVSLSGFAWEAAFIIYLIAYGPLFWRPRVDA